MEGSIKYSGRKGIVNGERIRISDEKVGNDFTNDFDSMWYSDNYIDYK